MISSKIDRETVTNALHKKVSTADLAEVQKEIEQKITTAEEMFQGKVEQILTVQDQFMKLVESGDVCKKHTATRHNPQLEDIRKRIEMKVDRREIDVFTQECLLNIERVKDEFAETIKKLSTTLDVYRTNSGILQFFKVL